MRMNDTFAATVAAVVPVLWLVAVVEVHQYQRRLLPAKWPMDDQLANIAQVTRATSGAAARPEFIAEARLVLEEARLYVPDDKRILDRFVTQFETLSVGLICLEALSLLWLLGMHDAPVVMGWVSFCGTMLGLLGVLRLPVAAINQGALHSVRQRARDLQQVGEFLGRHPDD
ncbi:hypothetical protein [Streptomyces anulatus]|uniref:hypothetical protein n=1 Tax=Streptomyces anulatus TaxID=1892 RepID=UPI0036D20002